MTNHVHLLLTPVEKWGASRMMQLLGATYVANTNLTYNRTGALWEGRVDSNLKLKMHSKGVWELAGVVDQVQ